MGLCLTDVNGLNVTSFPTSVPLECSVEVFSHLLLSKVYLAVTALS